MSGLAPGSVTGDTAARTSEVGLEKAEDDGTGLTPPTAALLHPPAQHVDQPCNHLAEQREISHVVDGELQRLRRQLSELGLVGVLDSCQTEAETPASRAELLQREPTQACPLLSPTAMISTPAAFSWCAAATASS